MPQIQRSSQCLMHLQSYREDSSTLHIPSRMMSASMQAVQALQLHCFQSPDHIMSCRFQLRPAWQLQTLKLPSASRKVNLHRRVCCSRAELLRRHAALAHHFTAPDTQSGLSLPAVGCSHTRMRRQSSQECGRHQQRSNRAAPFVCKHEVSIVLIAPGDRALVRCCQLRLLVRSYPHSLGC